jgi:hypothetical protein
MAGMGGLVEVPLSVAKGHGEFQKKCSGVAEKIGFG